MSRLDAYPPADPFTGTEVSVVAQTGLDGKRHTRSASLEYWIALIQQRIVLPTGGIGGGGGTEDASAFIFTQSTPVTVWTIIHNQERYPQVTVVDSAGDVVDGDVSYLDNNQIRLTFSAPFAGAAYCT